MLFYHSLSAKGTQPRSQNRLLYMLRHHRMDSYEPNDDYACVLSSMLLNHILIEATENASSETTPTELPQNAWRLRCAKGQDNVMQNSYSYFICLLQFLFCLELVAAVLTIYF